MNKIKLNIQLFGTPYLEFEDLPSTDTPLTANNLNQMQSDINDEISAKNNLFYARKTEDQYIPANTEQAVRFETVVTNQGNGFSFANSQVTVEDDNIKSVTVTAAIFNKGWGNMDGSLRIRKNNDVMACVFFNASNYQINASFAVEKNDIISIAVTSTNAVTISNSNNISFLSVKS